MMAVFKESAVTSQVETEGQESVSLRMAPSTRHDLKRVLREVKVGKYAGLETELLVGYPIESRDIVEYFYVKNFACLVREAAGFLLDNPRLPLEDLKVKWDGLVHRYSSGEESLPLSRKQRFILRDFGDVLFGRGGQLGKGYLERVAKYDGEDGLRYLIEDIKKTSVARRNLDSETDSRGIFIDTRDYPGAVVVYVNTKELYTRMVGVGEGSPGGGCAIPGTRFVLINCAVSTNIRRTARHEYQHFLYNKLLSEERLSEVHPSKGRRRRTSGVRTLVGGESAAKVRAEAEAWTYTGEAKEMFDRARDELAAYAATGRFPSKGDGPLEGVEECVWAPSHRTELKDHPDKPENQVLLEGWGHVKSMLNLLFIKDQSPKDYAFLISASRNFPQMTKFMYLRYEELRECVPPE